MSEHEGFLGRGRTSSLGRKLWIPQCSCGWRHDGYYQRPAALRCVERHLAQHAEEARVCPHGCGPLRWVEDQWYCPECGDEWAA